LKFRGQRSTPFTPTIASPQMATISAVPPAQQLEEWFQAEKEVHGLRDFKLLTQDDGFNPASQVARDAISLLQDYTLGHCETLAEEEMEQTEASETSQRGSTVFMKSGANLSGVVGFARSVHNRAGLLHNQIVSVNPKLREYIEDELTTITGSPFKIQIQRSPTLLTEVKAFLCRYPQHAIVVVQNGLNNCWERFVVCKELCHLLTDTEADFAKSTGEQIINAKQRKTPDMATTPFTSEEFNFYCAVEILFPWKQRRWALDARRKGYSYFDIAKRFLIPAAIAEFYFESSYGPLSEEINEDFREEDFFKDPMLVLSSLAWAWRGAKQMGRPEAVEIEKRVAALGGMREYALPGFRETSFLDDFWRITNNWEETDDRRCDLIEKQFQGEGRTDVENAEFAELQRLYQLRRSYCRWQRTGDPNTPMIDEAKLRSFEAEAQLFDNQ
jgi:hypothetical protein